MLHFLHHIPIVHVEVFDARLQLAILILEFSHLKQEKSAIAELRSKKQNTFSRGLQKPEKRTSRRSSIIC